MDPKLLMRAHQYRYYCLGDPVISDYEYDMFCRLRGLDGKGGSDLESSYTHLEKTIDRDTLVAETLNYL